MKPQLIFTPSEGSILFPFLSQALLEQATVTRMAVSLTRGEAPGELAPAAFLSLGGERKLYLQPGEPTLLLEACPRCRLGTYWQERLECKCGYTYARVLEKRKGGLKLTSLGEGRDALTSEEQDQARSSLEEWLASAGAQDPLTATLKAGELVSFLSTTLTHLALARQLYQAAYLAQELAPDVALTFTWEQAK